MSAFVSLDML